MHETAISFRLPLGKLDELGIPKDLRTKIVGFAGDRTVRGDPHRRELAHVAISSRESCESDVSPSWERNGIAGVGDVDGRFTP